MNVIIIIAVVAIMTLLIVVLLKNAYAKDDASIKHIIQKYPDLVSALLNRNKVTVTTILSNEEKDLIKSLSKQDWIEWHELQTAAVHLSNKYPLEFDDYIMEFFNSSMNRPLAQSRGNLFVPIAQKRKRVISALKLDELRQLCSESNDCWEKRKIRISKMADIQNHNPKGFQRYCKIKQKQELSSLEIIRDKNLIEQFQRFAEQSQNDEEWEIRQDSFALKYYEILKGKYGSAGRYVYEIPYNRITEEGECVKSKFKIWQSFSSAFSSSHLNQQTSSYIEAYNRVSAFKNRTRYFYDSVYNTIIDVIKQISIDENDKPLVIFVNNCNAEWDQISYDYHYKRLKKGLKREHIFSCDLNRLYEYQLPYQISSIFIVDFLTTNEDLYNNCKSIISYFDKVKPTIAYHSFLKDYSADEILELLEAEKREQIKKASSPKIYSKDEDIKFIIKLFEKVNKHPYFSYTAAYSGDSRSPIPMISVHSVGDILYRRQS